MRKQDMLSHLCSRHQVRSILDLGCGGLPILRHSADFDRYDYTGLDSSEERITSVRVEFPSLRFVSAALRDIADLNLNPPDLVICFDTLFHIEDDETYDRLCEYVFNCGAKAVALTCAVGREESNGVNLWYRDFWKRADRLGLGYVHKVERPFRLPSERLISFSLVSPRSTEGTTEVVYVCSPDREDQLFVSLGTLLRSGSSFDRVVVFCVGPRPASWQFSDPRIVVKEVSPLFGDYFYGNKLYLCSRRASRVIFLDADTFVQRPLDLLWSGRDADFLARAGAAYGAAEWNSGHWQKALHRAGAVETPMFNAGVLVFQNYAHRRIQSAWSRLIGEYLSGGLPQPFNDPRMPEQWALALAVGSTAIRTAFLDATDHGYGWMNESTDETVVLHGGWRYGKCVEELGVEAAPVAPSASQQGDGMGINEALERTVAGLSQRVVSLERQVSHMRASRTFMLGTFLASMAHAARALVRSDLGSARREWLVARRSLKSLVAAKT